MKNNAKLNALQGSFAVLLCGIIQSDGVVSEKERGKFDDFFAKEFGLSQDKVALLFEQGLNENHYDEHIALLKEGFSSNPVQMMKFMQYLNETIFLDGIGDGEYALFEKIRDRLT